MGHQARVGRCHANSVLVSLAPYPIHAQMLLYSFGNRSRLELPSQRIHFLSFVQNGAGLWPGWLYVLSRNAFPPTNERDLCNHDLCMLHVDLAVLFGAPRSQLWLLNMRKHSGLMFESSHHCGTPASNFSADEHDYVLFLACFCWVLNLFSYPTTWQRSPLRTRSLKAKVRCCRRVFFSQRAYRVG